MNNKPHKSWGGARARKTKKFKNYENYTLCQLRSARARVETRRTRQNFKRCDEKSVCAFKVAKNDAENELSTFSIMRWRCGVVHCSQKLQFKLDKSGQKWGKVVESLRLEVYSEMCTKARFYRADFNAIRARLLYEFDIVASKHSILTTITRECVLQLNFKRL